MPDHQVIRTRIAQIVAELGLSEASRRLNMKRETLLRLSGGGDVREGSMLLAAQRLGLLQSVPASIASTPSFEASR
jgi:hypothetical protein